MTVHRKNTMIADDHLARMEAILARDQRTTFHRVLDRVTQICAPASTAVLSSQRTKSQEHSNGRYAKARKKKDWISAWRYSQYISYLLSFLFHRRNARILNSPTTWLSLGCFLTLVVSINSSPLMSQDARWNTTPMWLNPCGLTTTINDSDHEDMTVTTDEELLNIIKSPTDNALTHIRLYINNYINFSLNHNFTLMNNSWTNETYEWLPGKNISKIVGHPLTDEQLKQLKIDQFLIDAFHYLQIYGVALEQVIWDLEPTYKFYKNLSETENKLRAVGSFSHMILCEVQNAIAERGITAPPDVERDIMPDVLRKLEDDTNRGLRNFFILRDYINTLEYLQQSLSYLVENIKKNLNIS